MKKIILTTTVISCAVFLGACSRSSGGGTTQPASARPLSKVVSPEGVTTQNGKLTGVDLKGNGDAIQVRINDSGLNMSIDGKALPASSFKYGAEGDFADPKKPIRGAWYSTYIDPDTKNPNAIGFLTNVPGSSKAGTATTTTNYTNLNYSYLTADGATLADPVSGKDGTLNFNYATGKVDGKMGGVTLTGTVQADGSGKYSRYTFGEAKLDDMNGRYFGYNGYYKDNTSTTAGTFAGDNGEKKVFSGGWFYDAK